MADSRIRTRHLWFLNRGDAHTFILVKVLTTLQEILRIMGRFWKRKKTPTTELNIFLPEKFVDGK